MTTGGLDRRWRRIFADGAELARTARVEGTAAWPIHGAGHWAWQPDVLALDARIGHRHRREQRLRVGMVGRLEQGFGAALLHDLAEVHHHDAVGKVADHGEVVRHEQVRCALLSLQILEQIEDRSLHRYV